MTNYFHRALTRTEEVVGGAAKKVDGVAKKTSEEIGQVKEVVEGAVAKTFKQVGSDVSYLTDGASRRVKHVVGGVTHSVSGVARQVQTEAAFIQQKTDLASATVMNATAHLESGLAKLTTSPIGTQVGTQAGGVMFNGLLVLMPSQSECLELFKAINDLRKLIQLFTDVVKKLKFAAIVPGLGKIYKAVQKLGKFQIACVDVSIAASASINQTLPGPSTPTEISWSMPPTPPAQQTPD